MTNQRAVRKSPNHNELQLFVATRTRFQPLRQRKRCHSLNRRGGFAEIPVGTLVFSRRNGSVMKTNHVMLRTLNQYSVIIVFNVYIIYLYSYTVIQYIIKLYNQYPPNILTMNQWGSRFWRTSLAFWRSRPRHRRLQNFRLGDCGPCLQWCPGVRPADGEVRGVYVFTSTLSRV